MGANALVNTELAPYSINIGSPTKLVGMRTKFTVLGGNGFIGSHLGEVIVELAYECDKPKRNDRSIFDRNLGHLIYAVGLTADFRVRPYDTVRAHVSHLMDLLEMPILNPSSISLPHVYTSKVKKRMKMPM